MRSLPFAAFSFFFLLSGSCGNSGADSAEPAGEVSIAFTDAVSDELSVFEVDVTGIVFHRVNGAEVSVLPSRTRVDFAALEDVAELVVGRGLTAGAYTGLTVTVDFSDATVFLRNGTAPATVVDLEGNPITGPMDVAIDFAAPHRPRVVVNRNHLWMVELDLDQAVTPDAANNRVTFRPVLTASVDRHLRHKPICVTGILTSVDPAAGQFTLTRLAKDNSALGEITVIVTPSTIWQVDGIVHIGAAGLLALAGMELGTTRVFVQGELDRGRRVLEAATVEAGTGVEGNNQDLVEGLITARDNSAAQDCALTVLGRSRVAATGARTFNTSHTVNVRYGVTRVLRRGEGVALTTDHLNVGQRVVVFGVLTGTTLDAGMPTGVARQLRTSVFGTAAGPAVANTLTLDVARFDLRPVALFNFTVGSIVEAVPTAYTVDTTGLSTTGIDAGTRVRAIGFVNPVGVAGDANFDAVSLSTSRHLQICLWIPPSSSAITSATSTALTLDVSGALLKRVVDGWASVTLANSPAPTIEPRGAFGNYRILRRGGGVEVHFTFDTFATAVTGYLRTSPVLAVMAFGDFTASTQVMLADVVTVHLK